ncbi:hypothetical protein PI124_g16196 [Phytophthora idaei]|nr:hypothetical protein PI126_g15391 [Phytophthora idaei]KAG3238862.1 hypothetical protein PI124_g16196 [Phytophthora idaei]
MFWSTVGYETNNVFLHAYLDSLISVCPQPHYPILVSTADNNAVIEDPFCFVWNYTFTDKGAMAMRRHLNKLHRFRFHALSTAASKSLFSTCATQKLQLHLHMYG